MNTDTPLHTTFILILHAMNVEVHAMNVEVQRTLVLHAVLILQSKPVLHEVLVLQRILVLHAIPITCNGVSWIGPRFDWS